MKTQNGRLALAFIVIGLALIAVVMLAKTQLFTQDHTRIVHLSNDRYVEEHYKVPLSWVDEEGSPDAAIDKHHIKPNGTAEYVPGLGH